MEASEEQISDGGASGKNIDRKSVIIYGAGPGSRCQWIE